MGRVRSLTHFDLMGRKREGVIKKLKKQKNGYLIVSFRRNETKLVHRVVAIAFLGLPESKYEINHKDGNKSNNELTNLEWCTKSENQLHRCRILKNVPKKQTDALRLANSNKSNAVRVQVPESLLNSNMLLKDLSARTGVSISTLSRMRNEKQYQAN